MTCHCLFITFSHYCGFIVRKQVFNMQQLQAKKARAALYSRRWYQRKVGHLDLWSAPIFKHSPKIAAQTVAAQVLKLGHPQYALISSQ